MIIGFSEVVKKPKDLYVEPIRFKKGKLNEELMQYLRLLIQHQTGLMEGSIYSAKGLKFKHTL
jgi:hypothetical protein